MADRFATTISDADWFLVGHQESPNDNSTIALRRAVSGLSRASAYSIRTSRYSNSYVDDPYVDGVQWTGTWKVKDMNIIPVNEGTDSGSFRYEETIQYGSFGSCIDENMTIGRSQSEAYEQQEYGWMFYEWQVFDEYKVWFNIAKDYAEDVQTYMRKIHMASDLNAMINENLFDYANIIVYGDEETEISYTTGFRPDYGYYTVESRNGIDVYQVFGVEATPTIEEGKYYIIEIERYGTTSDCVVDECGWGEYPQYKFTLTELTQPQISRCYLEESNDGTFRLHRSLRSYSSDYFLKTRAFKYAGLVRVSGAPIVGDSTITLTGLLTQTDLIHQHARFQIGGDVYRVTADATATAGSVTLNITPTITQNTEDLCYEYTNQVQATFLAMR